MKQTLFLSVLLAVVSPTLLGVEYGYFYGSSTQPSNEVEVPAGSYLRFTNADAREIPWNVGPDSFLVFEVNGQIFREKKGSDQYSYRNRKFIGPCVLSFEFDGENLAYLPYEIHPQDSALSPQIAIPAGQSLYGSNDFLVQYSEDGNQWSNVGIGEINQSSYPKFYRLVLENPNSAIQDTNTNFGFGSTSPYTTTHFYKTVNFPNVDLNAIGGWDNLETELFLHVNNGEVFKFTSYGIVDQQYYFYLNNEHYNNLELGDYSGHGQGASNEVVVVGPATIMMKARDATEDGTDDCISYCIITQMEQAQLSGAVLTVPSGTGTYTLKIQVSDDLNNDWIDLGGTVPDTLSENMRFYRLAAVQN